MRGFRKGTKLYDKRVAEAVKFVVSGQAYGFLLSGFLGGLCGGIVGGFLAFGLGAIFF